MEVINDTHAAFALRQKLKVVRYDSPAFRDQSGSGTKKRLALREQAVNMTSVTSRCEDKPRLLNHTVNNMVNACYARLWRGNGRKRSGEEPGDEDDNVMGKPLPVDLGKDLDKLKKLRGKSRWRTEEKCAKNEEARSWLETPEKFIEILTKLREEKNNGECITSSLSENVPVQTTGMETAQETSKDYEPTEDDNSGNGRHNVHFPESVLLNAALQEGDAVDVENIIRRFRIDLNGLSRATGDHHLHKAILNDHFPCAAVLVQHGVDVNRKDGDGVAPIALAFRLKNFQMVALLVHSGADIAQYTEGKIEDVNQVNRLSSSVSKVFEMDV